MEEEGLKLLAEAREETGLAVVTELMDAHHLEVIEKYADIIQIGARNMQNFMLLKALGDAAADFTEAGMASTRRVADVGGIHHPRGNNNDPARAGHPTFETQYRTP